MNINAENLVSISEANQNFSRVARLVGEKGTAIILKNNAPRYVLLDYVHARLECLEIAS
jgi:antitoxin Phd